MKSNRQRAKDRCWKWMALYIKLRDAIEDHLDPDFRYVRCRTCGAVLERGTKNCQAGHYMGRGSGGSSGVYFLELNVATQCSRCNRFEQGAHKEFREYLLKKYDEDIVQDIERTHAIGKYTIPYINILELEYKEAYKKLLKEHKLRK